MCSWLRRLPFFDLGVLLLGTGMVLAPFSFLNDKLTQGAPALVLLG